MWVRWGYCPPDFWRIHPQEFWWIAEARIEGAKPVPQYAGGMTEAQVREIYEKAYPDGGNIC